MDCDDAGAFGECAMNTSAPGQPVHVRNLVQSRVTVSTTETGKMKLKTRHSAILKKTTAK
jgi:hypothetical protein